MLGLTKLNCTVPWFICISVPVTANRAYAFAHAKNLLLCRSIASCLLVFPLGLHISESRSECNSWSFSDGSLLAWNRGG